MMELFDVSRRRRTLFVQEKYAEAIPLLEQILARGPVQPRRHAAAGDRALVARPRRAKRSRRSSGRAAIAPHSPDVRTYLALHYARGKEWERAAPLLEQVVRDRRIGCRRSRRSRVREKQGALAEAMRCARRRSAAHADAADWVRLGQLAMEAQQTDAAIAAFESRAFEAARDARAGPAFAHDLELGVLYLAARRFADARAALDRVPAAHPDYPMALFKRAQVSVLLNEPDQRRAHRARAPGRRRDDARADRERATVQVAGRDSRTELSRPGSRGSQPGDR